MTSSLKSSSTLFPKFGSFGLLLLLAIPLSACRSNPEAAPSAPGAGTTPASAAAPSSAPSEAPAAQPGPAQSGPAPTLAKLTPGHSTNLISGAATLELTRQFLAVAPKRFNGSPGHAAAESFIKSHFGPEDADHRLETDHFTASTPAGLQSMNNYIVKYPGKKDGIIVLVTHYETNYPLKDVGFVGANDGACTSALLIEIGQYLRTHPPDGYSVWLVFDDGEEAVKEWSDSDSLYGTRHLAARWSQDGTIGKIKALLVADMIGDKDLDIDHDGNSSPALLALLDMAAKDTGHAANLSRDTTPIQDDTVPFAKRGVPVLDVIDFNYGPHNNAHPDGYHHTPEDTVDKLSAKSLQSAGDIFMELIHLIDQR